ncbi:MAG: DNA replication/repair protein RecF [Lachnospiraceae bacterium]|nr:DNA replication/repair protein RecF [Lachnospiraceae bacterium]
MHIENISLYNYRNIKELKLSFIPGINIFTGDNAQGKTNILEAIYVCAMGRSQRSKNDGQLVAFSEDEAHIKLISNNGYSKDRIDVHIKSECKKGIAVNGVPVKKLSELMGTFYVVIFSPEDLEIIKEGPAARRRFMDMELCQLSKLYYFNLKQYYRILKQRNALLKSIQKNPSLLDGLFVWDKQLASYGAEIIDERRSFIEKINHIASLKYGEISDGDEFSIKYAPNAEEKDIEKKLKSFAQRDIAMGITQTGPHKDDVLFFINGKDARIFGSQGQQRLSSLCLKLSETELIKETTGELPVLLLDDVLSELDKKRQVYLINSIENIQTFITCTGIEEALKNIAQKGKIFKVSNGKAVEFCEN